MIESKSAHREMLLANGRKIPVAVVRSRRARRYVLRLRDDGLARLTIPRNGSAKEAWEFAQRQEAWLQQQLQDLALRPTRPKEWHIGTQILFRGERVKIEIVSHSNFVVDQPADGSGSADFQVCCIAGFQTHRRHNIARPADSEIGDTAGLETCATNIVSIGGELIPIADTTGDLRPTIERHLQALAAKELPARTLEFAALHQLSVNRVTVRAQRSRWGSCSHKSVISLNWRLILTPAFVRDYIILHELMHLRQMNHSARFWSEVEQVCPDYRSAKLWLKENPGLLDR